MFIARCPTCRRQFDSDKSETMPFCSERCRLIDLGQWLDENRGIPVDSYDEEEDPSSRRDRSGNGDDERQ